MNLSKYLFFLPFLFFSNCYSQESSKKNEPPEPIEKDTTTVFVSPATTEKMERLAIKQPLIASYTNGNSNNEQEIEKLVNERVKQRTFEIEHSNTLSLWLLGFGLVFSGFIYMHLYKRNQGIGVNAFKLLGLTLVITAALFVVVAGYTQDQITPVIGLLGTIVGYIIGSKDKDNRKE